MPDPSLIPGPGAAQPPRKLAARVRARWGVLPGNLRGGVWFLAGAAILTVMLALIKLAGQSLHVTEILFFRQLTMVAISLPAIVLVVRLLIWVFTEGSIEFEGDEFAEWVDSILRTIWISAAVGAVVGFVLPRVGLAFFLLFWSSSVEIS